ncbi:MAG: hypothetical protein HRU19_31775 [Pseudobacteriovorax sp.]|nr:hypothetical protein [Pseudobacteriovorax sp.]
MSPYKYLFLFIAILGLTLSCSKDSDKNNDQDLPLVDDVEHAIEFRAPDRKWGETVSDTVMVKVFLKSSLDEKEGEWPLPQLIAQPRIIKINAVEGENVSVRAEIREPGIGDNPFLVVGTIGGKNDDCTIEDLNLVESKVVILPACGFDRYQFKEPEPLPIEQTVFDRLVAECEFVEDKLDDARYFLYRSIRSYQTLATSNELPLNEDLVSCQKALDFVIRDTSLTIHYSGPIDLMPLSFFKKLSHLTLRNLGTSQPEVNVSPLKDIPELGTLILVGSKYSSQDLLSLPYLTRLTAYSIGADFNELPEVSSVQTIYLGHAFLNGLKLKNLEKIVELPRLRQLILNLTGVTSLSFGGVNPNLELIDLYGMGQLETLNLEDQTSRYVVALNENSRVEGSSTCAAGQRLCKHPVLAKIQGLYGWSIPYGQIKGNLWYEYQYPNGTEPTGPEQPYKVNVFELEFGSSVSQVTFKPRSDLSCPEFKDEKAFTATINADHVDYFSLNRGVINNLNVDYFGISEPEFSRWNNSVESYQLDCSF